MTFSAMASGELDAALPVKIKEKSIMLVSRLSDE